MIGRIALWATAIFIAWLAVTLLIDPGLLVPSATVDLANPEEAAQLGPAPTTPAALIARFGSAALLLFLAATLARLALRRRDNAARGGRGD